MMLFTKKLKITFAKKIKIMYTEFKQKIRMVETMNEAQKGWVKLAEMYSEEKPTTWQELKDNHGVELFCDGVKYSDGEINCFSVKFYDGNFKHENIWFIKRDDSMLIDSETDRARFEFNSITQAPKFEQDHIIHNGVKYLVKDNNGEPVLVKAGHKSGDVVPISETKKGDRFMVHGISVNDEMFVHATPDGVSWLNLKESERTVTII